MGKIQNLVLAELAKADRKSSSASNKAKFLAMREDIEALIKDNGIPVINVWRILYEKKYVSYSYETFNRYCNRYILSIQQEAGKNQESPLAAKAPVNHAPNHAEKKNQAVISTAQTDSTKGFIFDNNPDIKDLM